MSFVTTQTVLSPVVAIQVFQEIRSLGLNACGRCKVQLELDGNTFLLECLCLLCKTCLNAETSVFPGWSNRTPSTKRMDRSSSCPLLKRTPSDGTHVCGEILYSEIHIHEITSPLHNNPRLAAALHLEPPSSSSSSATTPALPLPHIVLPTPPATPLPFPALTAHELVRRAAETCQQEMLPAYQAQGTENEESSRMRKTGECFEPSSLDSLFSRTSQEWANFYTNQATPQQQQYLMDRHHQNGPAGGPSGERFWSWFLSFKDLLISKEDVVFGIYEFNALTFVSALPGYRSPPHPSFKASSPPATVALLSPPPSLDLNSPNLVPVNYLGSMANGIPLVRLNNTINRATPMTNLGSAARIKTHLDEIHNASKLEERRAKELARKLDGWEDRVEEIEKKLEKMQGDLYGRGLGRAVAYGAVLLVGGDADVLLRSGWEAMEGILMVAVADYQRTSFVTSSLRYGLLPPSSTRTHTQRLALRTSANTNADYTLPVSLNRSVPFAVGQDVPGGGSRFDQVRRREQRVVDTTLSLMNGSSSRSFRRKEDRFMVSIFQIEFWFAPHHPIVKAGAEEGTMLLLFEEDVDGHPKLCDAAGYDSFSVLFILINNSGTILEGFLETGTKPGQDAANFLAARRLVSILRRRIEYSEIINVFHEEDPALELSAPYFDPGTHDWVRDASVDLEITEAVERIRTTSIALLVD